MSKATFFSIIEIKLSAYAFISIYFFKKRFTMKHFYNDSKKIRKEKLSLHRGQGQFTISLFYIDVCSIYQCKTN